MNWRVRVRIIDKRCVLVVERGRKLGFLQRISRRRFVWLQKQGVETIPEMRNAGIWKRP